MQIILIILISTFAIYLLSIYEQMKKQKKIKKYIKESYGTKPSKKDYDFDKIGTYWNEYGNLIKDDEKIDDVTWNDLEMNQVFNRIDKCTSFVGEQILYSTLHCLLKNEV